jgi:dTDP-glucose 4,6-dehydratase
VNPIGPRGVYDEAKRFSEALTMAYHRSHRLDTKIVRIFNTYGPRMRIQDGRAIPSFLAQSIQGKPLTVFGDGGQTRSFCYIADLVEGIYRLLESPYHLPVNLGNPSEMTILEMAKEVLRVTRSRSKIVYRPLPVDDPKVRQPDISLANRLLHWTPRVGLRSGLVATARDFRMRLGKKASKR